MELQYFVERAAVYVPNYTIAFDRPKTVRIFEPPAAAPRARRAWNKMRDGI